jgi:hypothetical protein
MAQGEDAPISGRGLLMKSIDWDSRSRTPSRLLIIGLANEPSENGTWVWDLLDRVEPQLRELIDLTEPAVPMPELRKATAQHHRMLEALPPEERVILVTAAEPGEPHAGITRWHCCPGRVRAVRQKSPLTPDARPDMQPFYLEENIPQPGFDLIRIPARVPIPGRRARQRVVASGLLGLLWDIVRETHGTQVRDRVAA